MSNVLDAISGAIWYVAFAIILLISFFILFALSGTPIFNVIPGFNADWQAFFTAMNNMAVLIMLGISLGAILSAFLIPSHPVFFFVSIVLIFINFMVVPPFVNFFNAFLLTPAFVGEASQFTLLIQTIQVLPVWTAAISLLAAVAAILYRGNQG